MARRAVTWFVLVGMVPAMVAGVSLPGLGGDMRVSDLRCEYLIDPLGIDVVQPRLSWKLRSPWRGQRQTAYQVIVASRLDLLRDDCGDLWNSGKVPSDQSLDVVYAAAPLASRTTCYWKVRVWDKDDKASPFSAVATWEMGLLDPNDWRAEWLVAPDNQANARGPAPYLRKTFVLSKWVKRARLYVCGLGYYELHLNGAKVGNHVLDPAVTHYDRRALYVAYDVTDELRRGFNAMALVLGNGWYNLASQQRRPTALCQLEVTFIDGSRRTIASDGTWRVIESPIAFNRVRGGETYNALQAIPGWDSPDLCDANWPIAHIGSGPAGRLEAQMLPANEVTDTLTPVALTEPLPGVYVFDLGRDISGWAQLRVKGPAGTKVVMQYAECLNADGTIDPNVRSDGPGGDAYILSGAGEEVWEPRFVCHGFRYVQVTGLPRTPGPDTLRGRVVHTAFDRAGYFECSDERLNRLQRNAVRSYLGNSQGWSAEPLGTVETGLYNFDAAAAYSEWMDGFDLAQPTSAGITPGGGGATLETTYALTDTLPTASWSLYEYGGDTRILAEHCDALKRHVDDLTRRAEDHIVWVGLDDWAPVETAGAAAAVATGCYYRDAVIVSKISGLLGQTADALRYTSLALNIRDAFNEAFYDTETGLYASGTPTAQSCALSCGLVPPDARQRALDDLVEMIEAADYDLDAEGLGVQYVIDALTAHDRADVAYEVVTRVGPPLGRHVSPWLYQTLAGIKLAPGAVGFKRFVIQPQRLGDVTWVRAEHESRYGTIRSHWDLVADTFTLKVTVPPNTTATVYVPSDVDAFVDEGPGYIHSGDDARFVGLEVGHVLFEAPAGTYEFVSRVTR